MKTIILNVPDSFGLDEKEIKMLIAAKLYEEGKFSLGEAAKLAEVSKSLY